MVDKVILKEILAEKQIQRASENMIPLLIWTPIWQKDEPEWFWLDPKALTEDAECYVYTLAPQYGFSETGKFGWDITVMGLVLRDDEYYPLVMLMDEKGNKGIHMFDAEAYQRELRPNVSVSQIIDAMAGSNGNVTRFVSEGFGKKN